MSDTIIRKASGQRDGRLAERIGFVRMMHTGTFAQYLVPYEILSWILVLHFKRQVVAEHYQVQLNPILYGEGESWFCIPFYLFNRSALKYCIHMGKTWRFWAMLKKQKNLWIFFTLR